MMRPFAITLLILVAASTADASTFRWPWEPHYRPHHRHNKTEPVPPPNCDQINEAVKALDGQHLERALRLSNDVQRETIAKCSTIKQ